MCLDYIYSHNHSRLTVKALAELTGLSPNYLSAKFRRETGHTIKETILCKKIEEANIGISTIKPGPGRLPRRKIRLPA